MTTKLAGYNLRAALPLLPAGVNRSAVRAARLQWGDLAQAQAIVAGSKVASQAGGYDVVLASDVLYGRTMPSADQVHIRILAVTC